MFKKIHRLSQVEFEGFFNKGIKKHGQNFQLIYSPYPHLKVAVVVPKKIVTTAVGRNQLRRQLYHQLKSILLSKTGVFIFITKKSVLETSPADRFLELQKLVGVIEKSR